MDLKLVYAFASFLPQMFGVNYIEEEQIVFLQKPYSF